MKEYLEKKKIIAKYSLKEWQRIEKERQSKADNLGLIDRSGKPFWFVLSPAMLDLIASIPSDPNLAALEIKGEASINLPPDSPLQLGVKEVVDKLGI